MHRRLEIRVTHLGEDVILRLRDNGIPFNPTEQVELAELKSSVQNPGLRILMESAKEAQYHTGVVLTRGISREIQYRNVLGLNVLLIRI